MEIESESAIVVLHDKILLAVLANMRAKRRTLSSATFRLAGIYLNYLTGRLPYSHAVYETVKGAVLKEI